MVSFSQGNIEALSRSGQIFATGMQDMTQLFAAAAKASMEDTMSTFKAIRRQVQSRRRWTCSPS
ncbi:MAG: phasin family protein [Acetobacteraceae bacterium]